MAPFRFLLLFLVAFAATLTPEQRRIRASQAGHAGWGNTTDRSARTKPGQAKFNERFLAGIDPSLPEHVRQQMAESQTPGLLSGVGPQVRQGPPRPRR